jgi:hypothetical protein
VTAALAPNGSDLADGGSQATTPSKQRRSPPRTAALYATSRLAIKPKKASALETVLRCLRPRWMRGPWWQVDEHLLAAATEAEYLHAFARDQAEKLIAEEGAESLAAIAREAERELREIAHRLRMRIPTMVRLAGVRPGSVLRPTAAVKLARSLDRAVLCEVADTLARHHPRRQQRRKLDRRPLVALWKDVEVLAAHLAPRVTWPEEWGDLVAMTDLAATANDLAERIEEAVLPAGRKGRRTRRYVPKSADERREAVSEREEEE